MSRYELDWDNDASSLLTAGESVRHLSPILRFGAEWKLQERIGLALFGDLHLLKKRATQFAETSGSEGIQRTIVRDLAFPRLTLETTLAFYF